MEIIANGLVKVKKSLNFVREYLNTDIEVIYFVIFIMIGYIGLNMVLNMMDTEKVIKRYEIKVKLGMMAGTNLFNNLPLYREFLNLRKLICNVGYRSGIRWIKRR
jgi:multisubunit Na+/H+ antiporter MnhB subunit